MPHTISTTDYDIVFVEDISAVTSHIPFDRYEQTVFIVDNNTRHHCFSRIREEIPDALTITVPIGEKHKCLATCEQIWDDMFQYQLTRKALVVNMGGGVVTDMGGFAASLYKRGVDFINIPTTLLAMVDATVGGKTGIDHKAIKNGIGLFSNPKKVIIYPGFLKTLPEEECLSGFAEMLKHGLLADKTHFEELMSSGPKPLAKDADRIRRSVQIKLDIVEQDPFEQGLRKVLNFGHTIGHALESYSLQQNNPLPHGHAVALGMIAELWLSVQLCGFPQHTADTVNKYLASLYGHSLNIEIAIDNLASFAGNDKKNHGKAMIFSLLEDVGRPVYDVEVSPERFAGAVEYLKQQL